ncbi:armadillo-type protein [Tirmania nivea]|nr:armadillo-type protein [Tirmania nivea]
MTALPKPLPKAKVAQKIVDEEVSESDDWSSDNEEEGEELIGGDEADAEGDVSMEGGTNNGVFLAGSSKSRETHAAQKKLAAERKAARPNSEIVTRGKRIWEQIRRHELPSSERRKLVDELCQMIKGNVKALVFKHDASRIVQTAVKRGTPQQKKEIAKELKGEYVNMAQSTYGRYLLVKLMYYGDQNTKSQIISEFYGHVRKLVKHREAAIVVEDVWQYATPKEQERIMREFYGVEFAIFKDDSEAVTGSLRKILERAPEKRAVIMKSLFDLIQQLVSKDAIIFSIVHRALLEYISNATPGTSEVTEFLELVTEHLHELPFTKPGAAVVQLCITHGTAKDRKAMLKKLKPIIGQLAEHESGFRVILSMYECVDDTTLVAKTVLPGFQPKIMDLTRSNVGRIPLLYPFVGRNRRLVHPPALQVLKDLDHIRHNTSKKDLAQKQAELVKQFAPTFIDAIKDNAMELVQDAFGSKFIYEVIFGANDSSVGVPREKMDAALEAVAETAKGDPQDDGHVMQSLGAGRLFKLLVQGGPYDDASKSVKVLNPPLNFHSVLYPRIQPELGIWATGNGSWVIENLVDAHGFGQKEEVKAVLKSHMKKLEEVARGGNKGSEKLIEKLK